jgi:hypothetical protein
MATVKVRGEYEIGFRNRFLGTPFIDMAQACQALFSFTSCFLMALPVFSAPKS